MFAPLYRKWLKNNAASPHAPKVTLQEDQFPKLLGGCKGQDREPQGSSGIPKHSLTKVEEWGAYMKPDVETPIPSFALSK